MATGPGVPRDHEAGSAVGALVPYGHSELSSWLLAIGADDLFSSRELAIACWLPILFGTIGWAARKEIAALLASAKYAVVWLPPLGLAIWIAFATWLVSVYVAITPQAIKDIGLWTLVTGTTLVFQALTTGKPRFLANVLLSVFVWTTILEAVLETYTLPFLAEIVLLPVFAFFSMIIVVSGRKTKFADVRKLFNVLIGFAALTIGMISIREFVQDLMKNGPGEIAVAVAVPALATVVSIPYLAIVSAWIQCDTQFRLIDNWLGGAPKLAAIAKRRMMAKCLLNSDRMRNFKGQFYIDISSARTESAVREIIDRYAILPIPKPARCEYTNHYVKRILGPNDFERHDVYIGWRNVGPRCVAQVLASVTAIDASGNTVKSPTEVTIFLHSDNRVPPGAEVSAAEALPVTVYTGILEGEITFEVQITGAWSEPI